MDRLAIELLDEIFILACTDGGYTGSSLSLVSKHIRAVSRTARFHTVAIHSRNSKQVSRFYAYLVRERARSSEGVTPRVRHLLLASAVPETSPPPMEGPWTKASSIEYKRRIFAATAQRGSEQVCGAFKADRTKFLEDVQAVMQLLSPDLYTLTLVHCHRHEQQPEHRLPERFEVPGGFPRLRELTIAGPEPAFALPAAGGEGASECMFPSMARLHIVLLAKMARPTLDLARWADRAPALTHLRVSDIADDSYHESAMEALQDGLGSKAVTARLKQVVVRPRCPTMYWGRFTTPPTAYSPHMARLDEICWSTPVATVLFPPTKPMKERDWEVRLKSDWRDRVLGRLGCWDVAEKEYERS
ncbi:hypothetical protein C8Q80DRAFT_1294178 [Daedaleopsis nitida]|nr:hypothetical protein C8Q80DRAFT_1294178 [Daedaleopsis nitida]